MRSTGRGLALALAFLLGGCVAEAVHSPLCAQAPSSSIEVAWAPDVHAILYVFPSPNPVVNVGNCHKTQMGAMSAGVRVRCTSLADMPTGLAIAPSPTWWTMYDSDSNPIAVFVQPFEPPDSLAANCRIGLQSVKHAGWKCLPGAPVDRARLGGS